MSAPQRPALNEGVPAAGYNTGSGGGWRYKLSISVAISNPDQRYRRHGRDGAVRQPRFRPIISAEARVLAAPDDAADNNEDCGAQRC